MPECTEFRRVINAIDDDVLQDLLTAAQSALNDVEVVEMVADETGMPKEKILALLAMTLQITDSIGKAPELTTSAQIEAYSAEIANELAACDIS